jgi:DNA invertase Pin-like site-specific DNA recombinase/post-segregation antitoxin (ccd killing protein)
MKMAERVQCLYRVSTTKQVDHDDQNQADIPVQRKACREFAKKMGWIIVGEEQETGVSGFKVSADDRDKLQLVKEKAELKKFDILLVFMFDRLGRRSDETPFVVEWFVKKGIRVWSVNEGEQRFESHTDRLTNYIRFWQADGESQKTSIRTKTALSQMVLEGRFRGGKTPYGYKLEKSGIFNKRKHEVNRLAIDDEEAEVVRMMFDLCVSSGYGKFRLAHFLNDHGIRNRQGENWHDATIGAILHNPLYKGVLRSGETYSEPFDELQIIKPELFDMAQSLMTERTNENKEYRTMPLNTTGQSLLSGNVFCGHCGGRLVLTTNGKVYRQPDGTPLKKKRFRYVCYNKTRHRIDCDGQTGYTMHILDDIVVNILHQVFDKMKSATSDMIVGNACQKQMALLQADLKRARTENTKANTDYESLKAEVLKAVQGKSALPMEVLNELLEETRQRVLDTSRRVTELTMELDNENSKLEEFRSEFERIATWSEIFDSSDTATKKMICGYIIKRVTVRRDYKLAVDFTINVEQFLNGIDSVTQAEVYDLPMAQ